MTISAIAVSVAAVCAAACHTSARSVPLTGSAADEPHCFPVDATIDSARVSDGKVVACAGQTCWTFEVSGRATPPERSPATRSADITVAPTGIEVCAPGSTTDCKTIATTDYPDGGESGANTDRSLVAVGGDKAVAV